MPVVIIRKYTNRKLYNMQSRRYVNYKELWELHLAKQNLLVLDRQGNDLTVDVLFDAAVVSKKTDTAFKRAVVASAAVLVNDQGDA